MALATISPNSLNKANKKTQTYRKIRNKVYQYSRNLII